MRLVLVFAGLGLLLSAVGVYSVIAFVVARREREIGIRMALGADRWTVVRLVLRQSLMPIAIGLVLGGGSSVWTSRLLAESLFRTDPGDITVTSVIVFIVLAAGLAASWVPAQRASRVDPCTALRQD